MCAAAILRDKESRSEGVKDWLSRPHGIADSAAVLRTGDTEIVIEEASKAMKAEVRSISRTRLGQSSYIRDRLIYGSREYETHTHT